MTQPQPLPACGDPEHRHTGCCQNWKSRSAAEGRAEQDCGPGCPTHGRFINQLVTVARARQLANDYRDKPTPARAHNAAQTLGAVLDTLDAVVARTFAITDENSRLVAASPLGKAARRTRPGLASIDATDERQHPAWPPIDDENPTAPDCVKERLQYKRTRCAEPTCKRCWLGGPDNWPRRPLATGGIVDPTRIHRIGE